MSDREKIIERVYTFEEFVDYDENVKNLSEFLCDIVDVFNKIPVEFRASATVSLHSGIVDYDDTGSSLYVDYTRTETDDEYTRRTLEERRRADILRDNIERKEREEYERLRKKFAE